MYYSARVFILIFFNLLSLFAKGYWNYKLMKKSNINLKYQKKRTKLSVGSKEV